MFFAQLNYTKVQEAVLFLSTASPYCVRLSKHFELGSLSSVLYSLLDQPANRVLTSMGPDDVKPGGLSVRNFLDQNNGILKMNDDCLELNMEYGESYYFKILSRLTFIENFYEEYFITVYYQSG